MKITSHNYTISLVGCKEAEIDLDELECICHQMEAIANGWGHDYEKVFWKEDYEVEWNWRANEKS